MLVKGGQRGGGLCGGMRKERRGEEKRERVSGGEGRDADKQAGNKRSEGARDADVDAVDGSGWVFGWLAGLTITVTYPNPALSTLPCRVYSYRVCVHSSLACLALSWLGGITACLRAAYYAWLPLY